MADYFRSMGAIGTVCFLVILILLFVKMQKMRMANINAYAGALVSFVYILISSLGEPAFHNVVAIPLGLMIGYAFSLEKKYDQTARI